MDKDNPIGEAKPLDEVKAKREEKQKLKINPKDLRIANDLSQNEFWEKVGITQSGGSRYENGERRMPDSLTQILRLTWIEKINLKDVTRDSIEVSKLLQQEQPEVYASLLKEVKLRRRIK
ncbi:helix-turn-helix transcriptional regulator [Methylotenera sp.]|uniref:helix-turn-helix domain-containing protein n=1 Tax=Methylotenera sp. TaxID=2051956 RepID=UPI002487ECFD|nr:helix-turn-helix transcriptional regulator [Methylotenera sp.]MDI1360642.1 helix-turn-helix transcriptional regulator [Methylotenera sp.]